jgi:AcrR family transcriptional regulator
MENPLVPAALKPRKRPIQSRSAATVEAILEATIRILRAEGWARLTTTRVATLAGVSVGSLYQYFPNREAIALALVRRRTRHLLEAILATDLTGAVGRAEAIDRVMSAFLAEKRRDITLSLAMRDVLADVQGRQAIMEEARTFLPPLQDKLTAALGGRPDSTRLAMALAAVEGTVWEALTQEAGLFDRPAMATSLSGVFEAVLRG